jgi:hypothetical protein
MLARISLRSFVFSLAVVAALASGAAGQVGYYYPPYQTWPPSSPGFYPAPTPPIFQPYQLAPNYGYGSIFLFAPGYLSSPYGNVLIQPGYPGPYTYGYPYYGAFPYPYLYRYYNWYYVPQGPYLWRWHGRNYGPQRFEEQPGPTEVRPRKSVPSQGQGEPALHRVPPGGSVLPAGSRHDLTGPTIV